MTGGLKIVHVICSDAFAGVERYVSTLAPAQAARGARVTVVGGEPESMRAGLGADVEFVPAVSVGDARRALAAMPRADIVNSHMSEADLAVLLAPRVRRSRIVSTRHFAAPRGSSPQVRAAFRALQRRVALDISISDFVAARIGVDSVVIRTGVPEAADAASTPRGRTVLVAQRLEAEKDTDLALRAWAATRARADGWRLRIAGRGALRAQLESRARELGVADTVEFLGYRADVRDLMADASLLLATAPLEPYGLSVVEAMAGGLPVVAAAGGGHLETVGAVEDAALFPVGDANAAAELIDRLTADEDARGAYGERLRAHQRAELGVERWVDRTMAEYERVVHG